MQRLKISLEQFAIARRVANSIKEDRIKCDMNEHDFTGGSSDFLGFLAEVVIDDFIGIDRPQLIMGGTDGGVDVCIDGVNVDVKASGYDGEDPCLILFKDKAYPCDYFVLVVLKNYYFSVMGGISKKDFFEKCEERNFGYGPRLCVGADKLEPYRFKELIK